jgi:hypothetical protein
MDCGLDGDSVAGSAQNKSTASVDSHQRGAVKVQLGIYSYLEYSSLG